MSDQLALNLDTFDAIKNLSQDAAGSIKKLSVLPVPNHPLGAHYLIEDSGTFDTVIPPLPPRKTQIHCVDQVGQYALHARDAWDSEPAIYYSRSQVAIELADGGFDPDRGRAVCPLVLTVVAEKLIGRAEKPTSAWMQHRDFMRELRITLGDCFEDGLLDALSNQIGQLDFVQGDRARSVAVKNRESMGAEILHEVKAVTGEIPDEVLLNVRIYRDPVLTQRHEIRCLLETDPVQGKLALIPAPGQLDEAIDKELANLGDMLRANVRTLKALAASPDFFAAAPENADATSEPRVAELPWQIPVFYGTP